MLQTLLIINLLVFVPVIFIVEYFRAIPTYKSVLSRSYDKYIPYIFLFLLVNDVALFHIVPKEVINALSDKYHLYILTGGTLLGLFSFIALLSTLCSTNWRRTTTPSDSSKPCKCYYCRTSSKLGDFG